MNASAGAPQPLSTSAPESSGPPAGSGTAVAGAVAGGTGSGARLTVGAASLEEWHHVVGWAVDEGWNPGRGDVDHFHPIDPAGFFLGRSDGGPVSAVSIVNYSDTYAFLGYYLVHPEHRGTGLGLATWRAAWPHAGSRTIGLEAVPAQEATYERSGFTSAHRTLHFAGRPERPAEVPRDVVPVTADLLPAVAAFDRQCFPADRRAFLAGWLTGQGRTAYAYLRDGTVAGYAMMRPAQGGQRVGPLFADTAEGATALLDALTGRLEPHEELHLDIPETHTAALKLAAARRFEAVSHTVRMYRGPAPATRTDACWAVTSLELG